jgi:anthranilate phosphoribosyltransferase
MDEITISGPSYIAELKDGNISEYTVQPSDFGLQAAPLDTIRVANADEAKAMLLGVLDNQPGTARDIVLLNAGAAIYASGITATLADGVRRAAEVIASGAAKDKLNQLVRISNEVAK